MSKDHRNHLRQLLAQPALLQAPGVYDGLSALLVEQAGFDCAFLSGACLSFARFGRPDMGLVSASEVAETVAILRDRVSLPLIVDMDTGFGNALNVQRTVRDFERAGADALFIEAPASIEQMQQISGQFSDRVPLVHNLVEGGNSPVQRAAELADLGYRIALYPAALLHRFTPQAQELLNSIRQSGSTEAMREQMYELADMNRLLGADELLAAGKTYASEK